MRRVNGQTDSNAAEARGDFNMRATVLRDARVKLAQIRDEPRFELLTPDEADAVLDYLDALEDDHPRKASYQ